MLKKLVTLIVGFGGVTASAGGLPSPPSIEDARLHDLSIEIRSSVCQDFGGCKSYTISIDRDGRGVFTRLTAGKPKIRDFIRDQYVFRKLQIIVEPLRPVKASATMLCKKCGTDYEATTVIWLSDHGTQQTADFKRRLGIFRSEIDGPLVNAQNLLLSNLAPNIQQP